MERNKYTKTVSFVVSEETYQWLQKHVEETELTASTVCRLALVQYRREMERLENER